MKLTFSLLIKDAQILELLLVYMYTYHAEIFAAQFKQQKLLATLSIYFYFCSEDCNLKIVNNFFQLT